MGDVLNIIVWLVGVAYLVWASVAISRWLDRRDAQQGQP